MNQFRTRPRISALAISLPIIAALALAGLIGIWASLSHQPQAFAAGVHDVASEALGTSYDAASDETTSPITLRIFPENGNTLYEGGPSKTITVQLSRAPSDTAYVHVDYDPSGYFPWHAIHKEDVLIEWPVGALAVDSDDPAEPHARSARIPFNTGETDKYLEVHTLDDTVIDHPRESFSLKGEIQRSSSDLPGHGERASLPITINDGVCDRTPAITNELMSMLDITSTEGGDPACWDKRITRPALATVTELDISDEGITSLFAQDLMNLSGLTTVDVSGNSVTEWPEKLFDKMTLSSLGMRDQASGYFPWQMELIGGRRQNGDCRIALSIPPAFPTSQIYFYWVWDAEGNRVYEPDVEHSWSTKRFESGFDRHRLRLPDNAARTRIFGFGYRPILVQPPADQEQYAPLNFPTSDGYCPDDSTNTPSSFLNQEHRISAQADGEVATVSMVGTSASEDSAASVSVVISDAQSQDVEIMFTLNATTDDGDTILGAALAYINAGNPQAPVDASFIQEMLEDDESIDSFVVTLAAPPADAVYELDSDCKSATVTSEGAVTACAPSTQ